MRIFDDPFTGAEPDEPDEPASSVDLPVADDPPPASAEPEERSAGVPALPGWADAILDETGFAEPAGAESPPIWTQYRRAVESTVDIDLRDSVLRAGWLVLHGPIGTGEV